MECQICKRNQETVSGLNCPGCARASLYSLRLHQAQALIDKERIAWHVEQIARDQQPPDKGSPKPADGSAGLEDGAKTFRHGQILAEATESRERLDMVRKRATALKEEMEVYKAKIQREKALRNKRRKSLDQAVASLATTQTSHLMSLKEKIKDRQRTHDMTYGKIVAARTAQSRRAAALAGLTQIPKLLDANKKSMLYYVSRLSIPDIRHLNSAEPAHTTGMFHGVAHLVYQVCLYLQVRLPAEIVLPHSGYPWPSIYTPTSSYTQHEPPSSKKNTPTLSREGSLKSSREFEQRVAGRPRHLFVDKKLPKLAKENSVAYALFVEGAALLAWDIAWLCRIQGIPVAEKSWDDVCDIGRNLWLLLGASSPNASIADLRRRSQRDPISTIKQARGLTPFSGPPAPTALGRFSHASATNYLESPISAVPDVFDVTSRGWIFANPVKIIDELKAALLTEMSGHDWELLDEKEPEVEENTDAEEAVLVGNTGNPKTVDGTPKHDHNEERKGGSGWTKLKSRPST